MRTSVDAAAQRQLSATIRHTPQRAYIRTLDEGISAVPAARSSFPGTATLGRARRSRGTLTSPNFGCLLGSLAPTTRWVRHWSPSRFGRVRLAILRPDLMIGDPTTSSGNRRHVPVHADFEKANRDDERSFAPRRRAREDRPDGGAARSSPTNGAEPDGDGVVLSKPRRRSVAAAGDARNPRVPSDRYHRLLAFPAGARVTKVIEQRISPSRLVFRRVARQEVIDAVRASSKSV